MGLDYATAPVRYFVAAADEGELALAAQRLDLAHPDALLRAISELEAEIGFELLVRDAAGVRLTPDGEIFLAKARAAVAAYDEAARTAQRLARVARGELQVGFVGPPPPVLAPQLFSAFGAAAAEAKLSFLDLQFPRDSTLSWLGGVDVGLCFSPTAHPGLHMQVVREDPRVVIAPRDHPLSASRELSVAEVVDQTFVRFDPAIERGWASMLTLDDHRGRQPSLTTDTLAGNAFEMLTIVGSGDGIVVLAASHGQIIAGALPDLAVIPLRDAHPTTLTLTWRSEFHHPLVADLAGLAGALS